MPAIDSSKRDAIVPGLASDSPSTKGAALEELACLTFGTVPGVSVRFRRLKDEADSQELDIVLWNEKEPDGFWFLSEILLIEAKNWATAVGSEDVAWFDRKVKNAGASYGFLIIASGITGDAADQTSAHRILFDALPDGRSLIPISAYELLALTTSEELVALTKTKLCLLAANSDPLAAT